MVLIPAWILILTGALDGRGAHDQLNYHEPAIVRFVHQWPSPNIADYLSATSPGYHLSLAAAATVLGHDRATLQLLGSLYSAGLFALIGFIASGTLGLRRTILLSLPLVGSMYLFYPAVWLLPDNAGWLGVLLTIWIALRGRGGFATLVAVMLVLAALVFVRQIHIWALAPVWAAWFLGAPRPENAPAHDELAWDVRSLFTRDFVPGSIPLFWAIVTAALPCGIVASLMREWGGLTPPFFQGAYHGGNLAAPAFILALFGLFAPFYILFAWPTLARTLTANRVPILLGGSLGLLFALAAPTTYNVDAGRYSGLWNLARNAPAVADRSLLILPLSILGGCLAMAMLGTLARRDRWIMAATLVGFIAAQAASHELWQRYCEPLVLIWLTLFVTLATRTEMARFGATLSPSTVSPRSAPLRALPLSLLGIALGAMTSLSIDRARPVKDLGLTKDPKYAVPGWTMPGGVLPGP